MNEKKVFEISKIRKLVDSKESQEVVECVSGLKLEKNPIGEGGNAVIYIPEVETFKKVCLKKVKEKPQIMYNDIEEECKIQKLLKEAGVRTPVTLVSFVAKEGSYLVMERIIGYNISEIIKKPELMPEKFNYETFCKDLDEQVSIMHKAGIYHRDLHERNVMINEEGLPVIIDFGTATYGTGSDFTYEESVSMFNPTKGRYEFVNGFFKDDLEMVKNIKATLKQFMK